ncbi:site-specific DNA-methyltransferase [bacterium]|nr:site-specific DNA-methyltransferase [bacterium]
MENLLHNLKTLLQKDERLTSEGDLLKNKIIELALKLDKGLLKLLLSDKKMKMVFFADVDKVLIFDKDKFLRFVSNKQFLPDSYTAFSQNVGLMHEDGRMFRQIDPKKEVVLVWPYKDCVLEGGMTKEDQKHNEIFWNKTLAPDEISRLLDPKVFTNAKRIDKNGEHPMVSLRGSDSDRGNLGFRLDENGDIKDNLIIKGNNLLALHSLKKRFAGKVKLIYIDPPYNTNNDSFGYNDSFNHSTWLTFMKNRLEVAKDMLKEDGSIFIQINDIEQGHLKVLCDEVFGRENFHTTICVQMSHLSGVKMAHKDKKLPKIKEFILWYTKSGNIKLNPQFIPASWDKALERYNSFLYKNGYPDDECQKWKAISLSQAIKDIGIDKNDRRAILEFKLQNADLIFRTARNRGADYSSLPYDKFTKIKNQDGSYYFAYKHEDVNFAAEKVIKIAGKLTPVVSLGDIWTDIGINNLSNEGGVELRFGKKPEKLLERIINLTTQENEIVMDFFAGTGTTGAVAHKLNLQYILVEQLDDHCKKTIKRLNNVIKGEQIGISKEANWKGGGDFVYLELMKWNENFAEKIERAKTKEELKKLWETMKEKAFLSYKVDIKAVDENAKDFASLSIENQKRFLLECLDKNHLYVNYSEIDDEEYGVSEADKIINKEFHGG